MLYFFRTAAVLLVLFMLNDLRVFFLGAERFKQTEASKQSITVQTEPVISPTKSKTPSETPGADPNNQTIKKQHHGSAWPGPL